MFEASRWNGRMRAPDHLVVFHVSLELGSFLWLGVFSVFLFCFHGGLTPMPLQDLAGFVSRLPLVSLHHICFRWLLLLLFWLWLYLRIFARFLCGCCGGFNFFSRLHDGIAFIELCMSLGQYDNLSLSRGQCCLNRIRLFNWIGNQLGFWFK